MTYFGALKIGDWFSTFNSKIIFKKIDDTHGVTRNGEIFQFSASKTVCKIKQKGNS